MVYYDDRIIVPKNMKKYIMGKLYETHMSVTKAQKTYKQFFYRSGKNKDIEQSIGECPHV